MIYDLLQNNQEEKAVLKIKSISWRLYNVHYNVTHKGNMEDMLQTKEN